MAADPAALKLRLLQTVAKVAAEKNSTLVMPVPVELLRFFDRAAPSATAAQPPALRTQTPAPRALDTRPHCAPACPPLPAPWTAPCGARS